MPSLSKENIEQFQALYLKRFAIALTKEEALAKGVQLVSLIEVILKQNARSGSTERAIINKETNNEHSEQ